MDERSDVSFGDFSVDETKRIRSLSMEIQNQLRQESERHFTDALTNLSKPRSVNETMDTNEDEIIIHPLNESCIDDDLSYEGKLSELRNLSENNNSTTDKKQPE